MPSYRHYGTAIQPDRLAFKTAQAAAALGCHPTTVLRMVRAGRLQTVQVGARDHVTADSLRRLAGLI